MSSQIDTHRPRPPPALDPRPRRVSSQFAPPLPAATMLFGGLVFYVHVDSYSVNFASRRKVQADIIAHGGRTSESAQSPEVTHILIPPPKDHNNHSTVIRRNPSVLAGTSRWTVGRLVEHFGDKVDNQRVIISPGKKRVIRWDWVSSCVKENRLLGPEAGFDVRVQMESDSHPITKPSSSSYPSPARSSHSSSTVTSGTKIPTTPTQGIINNYRPPTPPLPTPTLGASLPSPEELPAPEQRSILSETGGPSLWKGGEATDIPVGQTLPMVFSDKAASSDVFDYTNTSEDVFTVENEMRDVPESPASPDDSITDDQENTQSDGTQSFLEIAVKVEEGASNVPVLRTECEAHRVKRELSEMSNTKRLLKSSPRQPELGRSGLGEQSSDPSRLNVPTGSAAQNSQLVHEQASTFKHPATFQPQGSKTTCKGPKSSASSFPWRQHEESSNASSSKATSAKTDSHAERSPIQATNSVTDAPAPTPFARISKPVDMPQVFVDRRLPIPFWLPEGNQLVRIGITTGGGVICPSMQGARYIILPRVDAFPGSMVVTSEETENILCNISPVQQGGWQLVLSSRWISDCLDKGTLVDEAPYIISVEVPQSHRVRELAEIDSQAPARALSNDFGSIACPIEVDSESDDNENMEEEAEAQEEKVDRRPVPWVSNAQAKRSQTGHLVSNPDLPKKRNMAETPSKIDSGSKMRRIDDSIRPDTSSRPGGTSMSRTNGDSHVSSTSTTTSLGRKVNAPADSRKPAHRASTAYNLEDASSESEYAPDHESESRQRYGKAAHDARPQRGASGTKTKRDRGKSQKHATTFDTQESRHETAKYKARVVTTRNKKQPRMAVPPRPVIRKDSESEESELSSDDDSNSTPNCEVVYTHEEMVSFFAKTVANDWDPDLESRKSFCARLRYRDVVEPKREWVKWYIRHREQVHAKLKALRCGHMIARLACTESKQA